MIDWTQWYKQFGSRLVIGLVRGFSILSNDDGTPVLDDKGNPIRTGKVEVTFVDRIGGQVEAPIAFPMCGNSVFAGGLPEIGSVCIVGFRENQLPVILAFLPHRLDKLFTVRDEVPNMEPGEFVIQSSDSTTENAIVEDPEVGPTPVQAPQFFSGARVKWDKYGRLVIQARGYDCIFGPVLSDEYTDQVAFVTDPITGQSMFFREQFAGGVVQRRVDQVGNSVQYFGKDSHYIVEGGFLVQVRSMSITAREGFTVKDRYGSEITLAENGDIIVKSKDKNVTVHGGSNIRLEAGGNIEESAVRSRVSTVGDVSTRSVAADENDIVGGDRVRSTGGDVLETIIGGVNREVLGGETESIGGSRSLTVGGNNTENVVGNESRVINGRQDLLVSGIKNVRVGGNNVEVTVGIRQVSVQGVQQVAVQGLATDDFQGGKTENVTGAKSENVTGVRTITVTGAAVFNVVGTITLNAPLVGIGPAPIEKMLRSTTFFNKFNSHTHTAPPGGGPTGGVLPPNQLNALLDFALTLLVT